MPSPSRARPAADGFAGLRHGLAEIARREETWAGIPMPIEGQRLIIEPSFPRAAKLMEIGARPAGEGSAEDRGWRLRNRWWSHARRGDILLMERESDGRIDWGLVAGMHHFNQDLSTLGCSDVWGLEQEERAMALLAAMLRPRQMKQYILTGMFLERSRRSGVTYMFRRLKPTVAMAASPGLGGEHRKMRILCALCLHPIAYYAESWAGAMCPTDDVIAHLAMMRGDEHMFWKRANQHPAYRPEAGL